MTNKRWPLSRDQRRTSPMRESVTNLSRTTRQSWRLKCAGIGSYQADASSKTRAHSLTVLTNWLRRSMSHPISKLRHACSFMRQDSVLMVTDANFFTANSVYLESKVKRLWLTNKYWRKMFVCLIKGQPKFRTSQKSICLKISSLIMPYMLMYFLKKCAHDLEFLRKSALHRVQ
jgi:hypothetical protein